MLGSLLSTAANFASGLFNSNKQAKLQKEFAQNAISWKAADAERAGISKVFAMGAPTHSYQPVSTGTDFSALGNAIDNTIKGQGGPHSTTSGKLSGISSELAAAQLDGIKIDNDIKRAELASKINIATQPGAGGILDNSVTAGPEGVKSKKEISPGSPDASHKSFGLAPEVDMYQGPGGGFIPQVPQQLQEAFENDWWSLYQWRLRNKLLPFYSRNYSAYPNDADMMYDPLMGQYTRYRPGAIGPGPQGWRYLMDRLRRK